MALEELLKDYPNVYGLHSSCKVINMQTICPVSIRFHDGGGCCPFSKACVDYTLGGEGGFPLAYFVVCAQSAVFKFLQGKKHDEKLKASVQMLEDFFANETNKKCLLTLVGKKQNELSEHRIQAVLAKHLFGPLGGDQHYMIGNIGFPSDMKKCPSCDALLRIGDTSFGNNSVWHGYADIFVRRSIVKVADVDKTAISSDEDDSDSGSGEPLQKRRRTADNGDEDYLSASIVGVKKKSLYDKDVTSQALSQTIVNAFCENKGKADLSKSFIPSFIASGTDVRIAMYSCGLDRLLLSPEMNIWMKKDENTEACLVTSTILAIWYCLNFEILVDEKEEMTVFKETFPISNFKKYSFSKFPIYVGNVSRPMVKTVPVGSEEFLVSTNYYKVDHRVKNALASHEELNLMLSGLYK